MHLRTILLGARKAVLQFHNHQLCQGRPKRLWTCEVPQIHSKVGFFFFLSDLVKMPLLNFPLDASLLEAANWGPFHRVHLQMHSVLQHLALKNFLPHIWHAGGEILAIVCTLALCDKPFRQPCRLHMNHPLKIHVSCHRFMLSISTDSSEGISPLACVSIYHSWVQRGWCLTFWRLEPIFGLIIGYLH